MWLSPLRKIVLLNLPRLSAVVRLTSCIESLPASCLDSRSLISLTSWSSLLRVTVSVNLVVSS